MALMRPATDEALPIDSACYPLVPFGNRVRDNHFSFKGSEPPRVCRRLVTFSYAAMSSVSSAAW
ncbi:hypothetical protein, partial [Paracoccus benzoatiresistens]